MPTETVISYTQARNRLASILNSVEETLTPVVITRIGHANVVLITEDELSSLQETAHLLRSPANARRLLQALAWARSGKRQEMTVDAIAKKTGAQKAAIVQTKRKPNLP
jgi:antitoxin YefM